MPLAIRSRAQRNGRGALVPSKGFTHEKAYEGESNDWITPRHIIAALESAGGPFDLDPCASLTQPWPTAKRMLTIADNGLLAEWPLGCSVYCNPPYGPHVGAWLEKLAHHGNGIALVFARTETLAWQGFVFGDRSPWARASAVLFLHGRLRFARPDGTIPTQSAGSPSALVAYGESSASRLRGCGLRGGLVSLGGAK